MSSGNPYDFIKRKKGARERVSTTSKGQPERVVADRETGDSVQGVLPTQPMGTVGLSLSVGMATEYAREKIEITVWENRPVHMDPADRTRTRSELAADLMREAQERLDGAVREFFPHMLEDGNSAN